MSRALLLLCLSRTSVPSENGLTDGDSCRTFKVSSPRQAENENEGKSMSIEVVENVSEEGIEKRGRKIPIMVLLACNFPLFVFAEIPFNVSMHWRS